MRRKARRPAGLSREARHARLAGLGAERLAEALLDWAGRDAAIDEAVELMIEEGDPQGLAAALRGRIAALARDGGDFVRYGGSFPLAHAQRDLLAAIRERVLPHEPAAAFELADAFLRTDTAVLERTEDSSGVVGDEFRDASRLWLEAAARCAEPRDWPALLFERATNDDFGVRAPLLSEAATLLPEPELRRLVARFEAVAAEAEAAGPEDRTWARAAAWSQITLLARALRDPALYERAVAGPRGTLNEGQLRSVAEFHLACGDAAGALERLNRAEEGSSHRDWRLRALCHAALGQREQQIDALWHQFDEFLWWGTFEELLALHPAEEREAVRQRARAQALGFRDAAGAIEFLLRGGWTDDAERRAIERQGQLEHAGYHHLLGLTELAHAAGRPRIEVACYRALLLDILHEGRSRAYHHAADYVLQLERLDAELPAGDPLGRHAEFMLPVREKHRRKSSFWAQLEQARRG
ncbi:MAG: hypothetical protein MUF27_01565 [Acidobacteria bacterium]|nr:hypothetical protein [Acidobacteriota bacterium]